MSHSLHLPLCEKFHEIPTEVLPSPDRPTGIRVLVDTVLYVANMGVF